MFLVGSTRRALCRRKCGRRFASCRRPAGGASTFDPWFLARICSGLSQESPTLDLVKDCSLVVSIFLKNFDASPAMIHPIMDAIRERFPSLGKVPSTDAPRLDPAGSALTLQSSVLTSETPEPEPQDQSFGGPQITEQEPHTLVDGHEPPIPAWKRLISRPLPTDERTSLITAIFSEDGEADAANDLDVANAQAFVDVIDEVLSYFSPPRSRPSDLTSCLLKQALDTLPPWLQKKCMGSLRKICGRLGLLPKSVKIQVTYDRSKDPLYAGGYADVWKGQCQDYDVAVKVLRVCENNDFEKITKVGSHSLLKAVYLQANLCLRRGSARRSLLGRAFAIQTCYNC